MAITMMVRYLLSVHPEESKTIKLKFVIVFRLLMLWIKRIAQEFTYFLGAPLKTLFTGRLLVASNKGLTSSSTSIISSLSKVWPLTMDDERPTRDKKNLQRWSQRRFFYSSAPMILRYFPSHSSCPRWNEAGEKFSRIAKTNN